MLTSLKATVSAASAVTRVMRRSAFQWSVEREPHVMPTPRDIINEREIHELLEATKADAKDPKRVRAILAKALDHALLRHVKADDACRSEFVQGLDLREAATLLNLDTQSDLMKELYDTALEVKRRIYGNRIVLFAPLYLANYCTNSCTYCEMTSPPPNPAR